MQLLAFLGLLCVLVGVGVCLGDRSQKRSRNPEEGVGGDCPCSDVSLCENVKVGERKEMFVFQVDPSNYKMYNWDHLTTVAIFGGLNNDMLCYAHQKQVRLVWGSSYPTDQLTNETYQDEWVNSWVQKAKDTYTDGLNIDYESPIDEQAQVEGFTQLVQKTTDAFHSQIPGSQVTVDFAWSPNCIDGRCYDYAGVANASDFVFIMDYDMRSQIFDGPPCYAGANSPYTGVISGMRAYMALGVPEWKLVLGVPWYGYKYSCVSAPSGVKGCEIESVPFRGVACSDAAGSQHDFGSITQILNTSGATLYFGKEASPFFNVVDESSGAVAQYWYDDPTSLSVKYEYAVKKNLRGMGMWHIDCLNYQSTDPLVQEQTARMWGALNQYFVLLQNQ